MMKTSRHLTWDNFQASVFVAGEKRLHRVSKLPVVEIFADGVQNRIGLWVQIPNASTVPDDLRMLSLIGVQTLKRKSLQLLELSVTAPSLFRQFYHLAVAVAERILADGKQPIEAVQLELAGFAELLKERSLLSIERQIGLIGELIVLERVLKKSGPNELESWIGPRREPHDFRLGTSEFEVKTTIRSQRIHTIHGTEQLIPSHGCSLSLLSVLLAPAGAGAGFSLTDMVQRVTLVLTPAPSRVKMFRDLLDVCGFRDTECAQYVRRFELRRALGAVRIDKSFPAITRAMVKGALGPMAPRIDDLQYDVNIEGLEIEDQCPGFSAIFPA